MIIDGNSTNDKKSNNEDAQRKSCRFSMERFLRDCFVFVCVCSDIKRTALARVVSKLRQIKALSDR